MNKLVDGTLIDILVQPGSDWWAEGAVLKSDSFGWYVCHPIGIGLLSPQPKTRLDDIFLTRVSDTHIIEAFASGIWRVRQSQMPETDEELRARLKKCPRNTGLHYMPQVEWESALEAASGHNLESLAADGYGVLRIGVPENYRPWGQPGRKS